MQVYRCIRNIIVKYRRSTHVSNSSHGYEGSLTKNGLFLELLLVCSAYY